MHENEIANIKRWLSTLKVEHRDLDQEIDDLIQMRAADQIQLQRMKKRKLAIKDQISKLESRLIPDLDA